MRNGLARTIGRPRKVIVLLTALAVALLAGPAGATSGTHGDASGTGVEEYINLGQDYGTATQPFCFEVTSSKYRVDMNGEFYAQDGSDQAGYAGAATLYWETTEAMESYYIAPEGIYAGLHENPVTGETECDPDTLGDPVEARVWVERVETDNGYIEDCEEPKENVYSRVSNLIEVDWTGECEVQSNDAMVQQGYDRGPVRADADHLFEGTLDAASGAVEGDWTYD